MISVIKEWLKKPFPFTESLRDKLLVSFIAGILVAGFLIIFQPFSINNIQESTYLYLSGFGLITTAVIAFNLIFLPIIFPDYVDDKWTIGRNIVFILWVLIIISFFNYVYGQYLVSQVFIDALEQSNRTGIFSWIFMTFSVGIFPVFFIIFFAERKLFKRNQRIAGELSESFRGLPPSNDKRTLKLKSGKSHYLEIKPSELICIRAIGGNYSTVYWQDDSGLQKQLLRLTLQNFLHKADAELNIVRCHKSFVVNLERVETVHGNARSLMLDLKGLDFEVPVSRSFPRERLKIIY